MTNHDAKFEKDVMGDVMVEPSKWAQDEAERIVWEGLRSCPGIEYTSALQQTMLRTFVADALDRERQRADNMHNAAATQNDEIGQTLGRALGYPKYADDQKNFPGATEADGVCVGDHVAETLAAEAARVIGELRQRAERAEAERDSARYSLTNREQFIRENAAPLLAERDTKITRQAQEIARLQQSNGSRRDEIARLQRELDEAQAALSDVWMRDTDATLWREKHATALTRARRGMG